MPINPTRRGSDSVARLVHTLAGISTAQQQARPRKNDRPMVSTLLVCHAAAHKIENTKDKNADSSSEPHSSATRVRVGIFTGATIGIGTGGTGIRRGTYSGFCGCATGSGTATVPTAIR